jgi:hypothetical protein
MTKSKSFKVKESKFDYFFGRVTSTPKNAARSLQNLKDLARLGIQEDNKGRERLLEIFEEGLTAAEVSRLEDECGVTITRSVFIENKSVIGDILVSYLYRDGDLASIPEVTTLIPRIYQQ